MQTEPSQRLIKLEILQVSSSYPTLGAEYQHPAHCFQYSPALTRTGKNYHDSEKEVPEGRRMSLAEEELAIQLALERQGIDPRKAEVFNDLFARNNGAWYAFQWTKTGLRVPKGYKPDKHETDAQGRKYWPRIALIGEQEVGEIFVPEGNGRVVVEWNEVFGIARVTSDKEGDMKMKNHTSHFHFDPEPRKDYKTRKYDVAVARWSCWHHGGHARCLDIDARYERSDVDSDGGFRQVQGSIPEIETFAEINSKQVKKIILEIMRRDTKEIKKMKKDIEEMPIGNFLRKYKLAEIQTCIKKIGAKI